MGRARAAVVAFWRKAYEDNLTGLASMVAYNLLLSIFPVALVALFVAGRDPALDRAAGLGAARPPAAVPAARPRRTLERRRSTGCRRPRRPAASSRSSPRSGSRPRSGARSTRRSARSTTAAAGAGCARSCSSIGMFARRAAVHRRQRRGAGAAEPAGDERATTCRSGCPTSAASSTASRSPPA